MPSDALAIVSVASGAVVAVSVPYISARLERAKLRVQAATAHLDELRSRLDDAVIALANSEVALEAAEPAIETAQRRRSGEPERDGARVAITNFGNAVEEVNKQSQLLAVRVGPHSTLLLAYAEATMNLRDLERELDDILAAGPSADDLDAYAEAVQELLSLKETYLGHKRRFLEAAADAVGPERTRRPPWQRR